MSGDSIGGDNTPEAFIRANTAVDSPPLVPEIRLHLATEMTPIWYATEETLAQNNLPPPYWAFPWVGGQALARYLLDRPETVRGRRVLDFGAGSGIVAIAAARSGAVEAIAAEIDRFAAAAITVNAELNGVAAAVRVESADVIGMAPPQEIILCGDVCYERPMADRLTAWLRDRAAAGATVLLGDPGRTYLPKTGLEPLARYRVPTTLELEDRDVRDAVVWRMVS
jgi:predicted nicotinamide N-methyase